MQRRVIPDKDKQFELKQNCLNKFDFSVRQFASVSKFYICHEENQKFTQNLREEVREEDG